MSYLRMPTRPRSRGSLKQMSPPPTASLSQIQQQQQQLQLQAQQQQQQEGNEFWPSGLEDNDRMSSLPSLWSPPSPLIPTTTTTTTKDDSKNGATSSTVPGNSARKSDATHFGANNANANANANVNANANNATLIGANNANANTNTNKRKKTIEKSASCNSIDHFANLSRQVSPVVSSSEIDIEFYSSGDDYGRGNKSTSIAVISPRTIPTRLAAAAAAATAITAATTTTAAAPTTTTTTTTTRASTTITPAATTTTPTAPIMVNTTTTTTEANKRPMAAKRKLTCPLNRRPKRKVYSRRSHSPMMTNEQFQRALNEIQSTYPREFMEAFQGLNHEMTDFDYDINETQLEGNYTDHYDKVDKDAVFTRLSDSSPWEDISDDDDDDGDVDDNDDNTANDVIIDNHTTAKRAKIMSSEPAINTAVGGGNTHANVIDISGDVNTTNATYAKAKANAKKFSDEGNFKVLTSNYPVNGSLLDFFAKEKEIRLQQQQHNKQQRDLHVNNSIKIPAIFVPNVHSLQPLMEQLDKRLANTESSPCYTVKSLQNGNICIQCKDMNTHTLVADELKMHALPMHTHQSRSERGLRVVIKYLHNSTPHTWIREQLIQLGFTPRFIRLKQQRFNGKPLNMFEVELAPTTDGTNAKIFKLNQLGNQHILVERQLPSIDPVQCHRCQAFGHTRNYCQRQYACFKCADNHPSVACQKTKDTPGKCANCHGPHVSTYRGCHTYKKAQATLAINKARVKLARMTHDTTNPQHQQQRKLLQLQANKTYPNNRLPIHQRQPQQQQQQQQQLPKAQRNPRQPINTLHQKQKRPQAWVQQQQQQQQRQPLVLPELHKGQQQQRLQSQQQSKSLRKQHNGQQQQFQLQQQQHSKTPRKQHGIQLQQSQPQQQPRAPRSLLAERLHQLQHQPITPHKQSKRQQQQQQHSANMFIRKDKRTTLAHKDESELALLASKNATDINKLTEKLDSVLELVQLLATNKTSSQSRQQHVEANVIIANPNSNDMSF